MKEDFIHFGVGPEIEDDEKTYHQYYQWVPLVLSLQAAMFYLPHWIWKVRILTPGQCRADPVYISATGGGQVGAHHCWPQHGQL